MVKQLCVIAMWSADHMVAYYSGWQWNLAKHHQNGIRPLMNDRNPQKKLKGIKYQEIVTVKCGEYH